MELPYSVKRKIILCLVFLTITNSVYWYYLCNIKNNEFTKEIKAADIIDPLDLQIPIAMKWIIKKEDVEKRVFLNVAAQYYLPQLPSVFLRFSIIKDRHNNDMIRFDVEVDKGQEKRIRTNLKIRVRSAKFEKWRVCEYIKKGFYGGNFTTKTDLLNPEKNFFVEGNLILDISGIISVDRPIVTEIENPINFHYKTEIVNPFPENDHCIYSVLVEEKRIKVGISMPQLEKIGDQPDIERMIPQTSIFGCGLVTRNKKFL